MKRDAGLEPEETFCLLSFIENQKNGMLLLMPHAPKLIKLDSSTSSGFEEGTLRILRKLNFDHPRPRYDQNMCLGLLLYQNKQNV